MPPERYNSSLLVTPANSDAWRATDSVLLVLVILAVILGVVLGAVVFCDLEGHYGLLGVENKKDALKYLGVSLGGVLVAIQAVASHRRAKAMEAAVAEQAAAVEQHAKSNRHTEEGLRQERLKNAIGHLGDDSMSVRLGSAYELFHLASDTDSYCHAVQNILCAHIRQTTTDVAYRNSCRTEPSVEIESLLSLLFNDGHRVFASIKADLHGSYLAGADLRNARLEGANLTGACLSWASLRGASLEGSLLGGTYLHFANLSGARLQGAILHFAKMQCANLTHAQCQGVSVFGLQLQEAKLNHAKFHGATEWTDYVPDDQEQQNSSAKVLGAKGGSEIPGFRARIERSIGKKSDLRSVTFEGGMRPDGVDELSASLTGENATLLRQKMSPHVGASPRREPPPGSGICTGSYNEQEAAQWIRNYPKPK